LIFEVLGSTREREREREKKKKEEEEEEGGKEGRKEGKKRLCFVVWEKVICLRKTCLCVNPPKLKLN
jgi:hypothetical protein